MIPKIVAALAGFLNSRPNSGNVHRRLSDLEKGQAQLSAMIGEFMTETEKVMEELSRLLREIQNNAAVDSVPDADLVKPRKSPGRIDAKYHVVQLSRQGKQVDEISSQLRIPTGEVQLILNLHQESAKSAVAK